MKGLLVVLLFTLIACEATGQYFQFSQYNFTSQRVSPTAPATSDYASVGFIYRNQGTGSDIKLNTNVLSASYPLISRNSGKRWSGIGVTVMDDRSGGIFNIQEASVSYAINVFLNRFESVALGFKGLYQQRKIDLGGLYTGSQYVADRGFDQSLFNGENIGTLRADFITFSTGLSWQHVDREGIKLAYWSLSLFDFNKPEESFQEANNTLPSTWVAAGGFRAFKESNMSFFPEALYTRNSANNLLNVGLVTRCDVKGTSEQAPFHVDVLTKYVVGRSGIIGLQFHNENLSLGFSYDFLIHKNNVANVGSFEVGLELRRLVNPQPKNKIVRKNTPVKQRTQAVKPVAKAQPKKPTETVRKNVVDSAKQVKPKPSLSSTLQMKRDSVVANAKAGKVLHQPFEIEKVILHFNFEFNSSDLDEPSTAYLDELTEALADDPHLRIKLTGHTDNVGSANFNLRLSTFRANAVKDYLVTKGVNPSRIETQGKGLTEPLNDNRTEADRAKNRRVELTIFYSE
jgi:type IX secretion system PorP/SprF family membrane protein